MKTQKKATPRTVRYGYKPDMTKDADQQLTIDYITRQYQGGFSYAMIADDLNEQGVPSARGGSWASQTVANVFGKVTMERVARLDREDKAAQAQKDAEAAPAQAERERQLSPEHQFETRGYYVDQGTILDPYTGDVEGSDVKWTDKAKYDNYKARDDLMGAARVAKSKAMDDAYLALTAKERADLHNFDLPWRTRPGQSRERVDEVVEKVTAPLREEADHWCDQIADQPTVKRGVRRAITTLLAELAIQRQATLHYHGELERERAAHQATKDAIKGA